MPFVKSNWTCEPNLEGNGFFEFGQNFTLQGLVLKRGEQTRPCFLHVSAEVECVVASLVLVASVEILDIYALVGPMDTFEYRHVSKVHGTPLQGPAQGFYAFAIDASAIPREKVWQLQLKLSSSAQGSTNVVIQEMSVTVEKLGGGGSISGLPSSLTNTTELNKSGTGTLVPASTRSNHGMMQTARSSLGSSTRSTSTAAAPSRGISASEFDSSLNLSRSKASSPKRTTTGASSAARTASRTSTSTSTTATTTSTSSKLSRSTDLSSSTTAAAGGRSSSTTTTNTTGQDLALRGGVGAAGGRGGGSDALVAQTAGPGNALQMREETAAVASVLNAVCEKMVGVVSEKTKAYLAKAGKRTERRVLDKMAKLEERIERFDHVLEHATVSSRELEEALLALDKDLSSPRRQAPAAATS